MADGLERIFPLAEELLDPGDRDESLLFAEAPECVVARRSIWPETRLLG